MKMKLMTTTMAALAIAAALQTVAKAEDPISPMQGAVCNLYWIDVEDESKEFSETASKISSMPAVATFVDTASEFSPTKKREGLSSSWGMWTGWLKQEKAGTYTFLCKRDGHTTPGYSDYGSERYSIWINGERCLGAVMGQEVFNAELVSGFNSVKIIAEGFSSQHYPLSITYKKAGGLKDPTPFGPADMWYDDEE